MLILHTTQVKLSLVRLLFFGEWERKRIEETILVLASTLHFLLQEVQAQQPSHHKVADVLRVKSRKEGRSLVLQHPTILSQRGRGMAWWILSLCLLWFVKRGKRDFFWLMICL